MKKRILLLIIFTLIISLFVACESVPGTKADTQLNATLMLEIALSTKNYEKFNELFSEERKNVISKNKFNEYTNLMTEDSKYEFYNLIKYRNDEMFLVKFAPAKIDGEYKIENVVRIPKEMRKLFETE